MKLALIAFSFVLSLNAFSQVHLPKDGKVFCAQVPDGSQGIVIKGEFTTTAPDAQEFRIDNIKFDDSTSKESLAELEDFFKLDQLPYAQTFQLDWYPMYHQYHSIFEGGRVYSFFYPDSYPFRMSLGANKKGHGRAFYQIFCEYI